MGSAPLLSLAPTTRAGLDDLDWYAEGDEYIVADESRNRRPASALVESGHAGQGLPSTERPTRTPESGIVSPVRERAVRHWQSPRLSRTARHRQAPGRGITTGIWISPGSTQQP